MEQKFISWKYFNKDSIVHSNYFKWLYKVYIIVLNNKLFYFIFSLLSCTYKQKKIYKIIENHVKGTLTLLLTFT